MFQSSKKLLTILILLSIPIPLALCDFAQIQLPGGYVRFTLQLFGILLSGPLLLLYSLLVHEFTTVKKKKLLSGIAFLVGFSWTGYLFYLHLTMPVD
ncbi:hypothetical protein [Larkinella rosea]|uniref:Uncharacterized protein n=1 Tax=Larkinella rosea TaxID=2025312 RepID=A0A3P1C2A1_9BACT|nr:hypothetical protein [Larkinella rosea]RRB07398.1 hypothetical protein EHT25_06360 [Larkinella rosea]